MLNPLTRYVILCIVCVYLFSGMLLYNLANIAKVVQLQLDSLCENQNLSFVDSIKSYCQATGKCKHTFLSLTFFVLVFEFPRPGLFFKVAHKIWLFPYLFA